MPPSGTPAQSAPPTQDTTSESFDSKLISSKLGAKLVAIDVSDHTSSKTYWLHAGILCDISPVFNTAFSGSRWTEGDESRMKWPECDPKAFDIFVHWLYTKQLPPDEDLPEQENKEIVFLRVLALGDRALIPSLQAEAYARIRTSISCRMDRPSKAFVHELYDYDLGSNKLRSYTVGHFAHNLFSGLLKGDQVNTMLEETPLFAVDMAKELSKLTSSLGSYFVSNKLRIENRHPYTKEWYKEYHGAESGGKMSGKS